MATNDYYQLLGVDRNASKDEIKKAFRKLAQKYHPDKEGGDQDMFKKINEAYNVLSDDKKRKEYDQFGRTSSGTGSNAGGGGGFGGFEDFAQQFGGQATEEFDLGDIFGEFFGGGGRSRTRRGNDIAVDVELEFNEAVFGTTRTITLDKAGQCDKCGGSGAEPGSGTKKCGTCGGNGAVEEVKQSILGSFRATHVCNTCHGSGQVPETKCGKCAGDGIVKDKQDISVTIPPGVESGQMVRMTGSGEAVPGGQPGDLYVRIHVKPHKTLAKEGQHLYMPLEVKLTEALTGSSRNIETLDGTIELKIPQGVTHGELLRVKGKGVPYEQGSSRRGDLFVKVQLQIPKKLSKKAKEAVETLKQEGY